MSALRSLGRGTTAGRHSLCTALSTGSTAHHHLTKHLLLLLSDVGIVMLLCFLLYRAIKSLISLGLQEVTVCKNVGGVIVPVIDRDNRCIKLIQSLSKDRVGPSLIFIGHTVLHKERLLHQIPKSESHLKLLRVHHLEYSVLTVGRTLICVHFLVVGLHIRQFHEFQTLIGWNNATSNHIHEHRVLGRLGYWQYRTGFNPDIGTLLNIRTLKKLDRDSVVRSHRAHKPCIVPVLDTKL